MIAWWVIRLSVQSLTVSLRLYPLCRSSHELKAINIRTGVWCWFAAIATDSHVSLDHLMVNYLHSTLYIYISIQGSRVFLIFFQVPTSSILSWSQLLMFQLRSDSFRSWFHLRLSLSGDWSLRLQRSRSKFHSQRIACLIEC